MLLSESNISPVHKSILKVKCGNIMKSTLAINRKPFYFNPLNYLEHSQSSGCLSRKG